MLWLLVSWFTFNDERALIMSNTNNILLVDRFARALAYHDANYDYKKYCDEQEYDINQKSFMAFIECQMWYNMLYPMFTITELRTLFELTHSEDV